MYNTHYCIVYSSVPITRQSTFSVGNMDLRIVLADNYVYKFKIITCQCVHVINYYIAIYSNLHFYILAWKLIIFNKFISSNM